MQTELFRKLLHTRKFLGQVATEPLRFQDLYERGVKKFLDPVLVARVSVTKCDLLPKKWVVATPTIFENELHHENYFFLFP